MSERIEMAKPTISERRWAVSVKIAMELERIPPIVYAMMKNTETSETRRSLRIAFLLFS